MGLWAMDCAFFLFLMLLTGFKAWIEDFPISLLGILVWASQAVGLEAKWYTREAGCEWATKQLAMCMVG